MAYGNGVYKNDNIMVIGMDNFTREDIRRIYYQLFEGDTLSPVEVVKFYKQTDVFYIDDTLDMRDTLEHGASYKPWYIIVENFNPDGLKNTMVSVLSRTEFLIQLDEMSRALQEYDVPNLAA
jgi:hypothetical protein